MANLLQLEQYAQLLDNYLNGNVSTIELLRDMFKDTFVETGLWTKFYQETELYETYDDQWANHLLQYEEGDSIEWLSFQSWVQSIVNIESQPKMFLVDDMEGKIDGNYKIGDYINEDEIVSITKTPKFDVVVIDYEGQYVIYYVESSIIVASECCYNSVAEALATTERS